MDDEMLELVAGFLRSGPVLGMEVDIRYRVLAVTVEPPPSDHPSGGAADRRLQVVVHPVGTIAASLVDHEDPDVPVVLQFDETQLPDVAALFADAHTTVPPFPQAMVDVDRMGDRLSMFGSAQLGDGDDHVLHLRLDQPEGAMTLDLWSTFDVVEVRAPDGSLVA